MLGKSIFVVARFYNKAVRYSTVILCCYLRNVYRYQRSNKKNKIEEGQTKWPIEKEDNLCPLWLWSSGDSCVETCQREFLMFSQTEKTYWNKTGNLSNLVIVLRKNWEQVT